jgi:hypothetical protein
MVPVPLSDHMQSNGYPTSLRERRLRSHAVSRMTWGAGKYCLPIATSYACPTY